MSPGRTASEAIQSRRRKDPGLLCRGAWARFRATRWLLAMTAVPSNCLSLDSFSLPPPDLPVVPICRSPFACGVGQITGTSSRIPCPKRGAYRDRHERWACGVRWTLAYRLTSDRLSGRRSRVVLTPRRWCQVGDNACALRWRWWQESPVHQEEHEGNRKTIAQGMPGQTGEPVVTLLACFLFFAREAAGASGIRHSLRPLSLRVTCQQPGRLALRDRGVVSLRAKATQGLGKSSGLLRRCRS